MRNDLSAYSEGLWVSKGHVIAEEPMLVGIASFQQGLSPTCPGQQSRQCAYKHSQEKHPMPNSSRNPNGSSYRGNIDTVDDRSLA